MYQAKSVENQSPVEGLHQEKQGIWIFISPDTDKENTGNLSKKY